MPWNSKNGKLSRVGRLLPAQVLAVVLLVGSVEVVAQQDPTVNLLAELTNAHGAPGFEGPVRDILRREWQGILKDLHTDGMGNLLGSLPGQAETPRVLLMAHMDEVGFLVRHISEEGFIYFNPVGGWIDQAILAQRWAILTARGPVIGYTGVKSPHIIPTDERSRLIPQQDMFIDIGAASRAEVVDKFGVRPGLPITPHTEFEVLNGTSRYLAKAWDDRAGLAVITEALRQLQNAPHPNNIQVAATVQEEIGLRGAAVVYASTRPDIVINLEIGIAGDFPLLTSPKLSQEALGKGPGIFVFDASMIPNQKYVDWIVKLAKSAGIPIQFESVTGYGEDAGPLQRSGQGVTAVNIGIPTRYAHTQGGVIDRSDYDNTVRLVAEMIRKLSGREVNSIREF